MHVHEVFKQRETLTGIITTNHDGLLQAAWQEVGTEVNLGIPFTSADVSQSVNGKPPVIHLHGSFTWSFGLPLNVRLLTDSSTYSPDTVWIPPTILKESKSYPFNKLAGLAYELLAKSCDVLRVIGSALTQNHWHVLSMIFNAQRHAELTKGVPFRVELIMPQGAGESIVGECSYLKNLTSIGQLTEGDFAPYKDDPSAITSEMKNPFFYWLKQKLIYHNGNGDFGATPVGSALDTIAGGLP